MTLLNGVSSAVACPVHCRRDVFKNNTGGEMTHQFHNPGPQLCPTSPLTLCPFELESPPALTHFGLVGDNRR